MSSLAISLRNFCISRDTWRGGKEGEEVAEAICKVEIMDILQCALLGERVQDIQFNFCSLKCCAQICWSGVKSSLEHLKINWLIESQGIPFPILYKGKRSLLRSTIFYLEKLGQLLCFYSPLPLFSWTHPFFKKKKERGNEHFSFSLIRKE